LGRVIYIKDIKQLTKDEDVLCNYKYKVSRNVSKVVLTNNYLYVEDGSKSYFGIKAGGDKEIKAYHVKSFIGVEMGVSKHPIWLLISGLLFFMGIISYMEVEKDFIMFLPTVIPLIIYFMTIKYRFSILTVSGKINIPTSKLKTTDADIMFEEIHRLIDKS
jgi:hypothetical protein